MLVREVPRWLREGTTAVIAIDVTTADFVNLSTFTCLRGGLCLFFHGRFSHFGRLLHP